MFIHNRHLFVSCLTLISAATFAQQGAYESPAGTKFLLYTPPGYNSTAGTFPLLLSLHSKGEVGNDLAELTSRNPEQMPCRLIYLNRWPQHLPFIVLTPQLKPDPDDPDIQWSADYIDEVVNHVTKNFRVDLQRIYVTGISRGGTGTWTYASAFPGKIAAILPISGRSDPSQACAIKNIPVWAFHGDNDEVASPAYSVAMVDAIKNCQPSGAFDPRLTVLHARNHNGWNEVYNSTSGYKVYDWLLMFSKNDASNKKPYVNAGPDRRIRSDSQRFYLAGDFFDSDGSIANINWTQIAGTSLALENTNSRFLKISGLKTGTYEFRLTVTDNRGLQSSDKVALAISDASLSPVVTQLVLYNGRTNTVVGNLTDGQTISMTALGLSEINVRAVSSEGTGSVVFTVNTHQNTRTLNAGPYFIKAQTASPEWKITNGEYLICATPYVGGYGSGFRGGTYCIKVTIKDGAVIRPCEGSGMIRQEIWKGISGSLISSIPLNSPPSSTGQLTLFEGTPNSGDNYGSRIRGYVCPPVSGNYQFWISGNDKTELWLSTDDDPDKKRLICSSALTNLREWNKYPSQKSTIISLVANRRYYIEALHKEAIANDHISVGWQLPDGTRERPIPGLHLIPFDEPNTSACTGTGQILREVWTGISGTMISSIPLATSPTSSSTLTIFEAPANVGDNYGSRIRGLICAPATGNYVFWISGNDKTELWLSTDRNPANKKLIASAGGYTNVREWRKFPRQQSAPIALLANQQYYIEALHKEGIGSDHVAVGWQLPNGTLERPVPGNRLAMPPSTASASFVSAINATPTSTSDTLEDLQRLSIFPNPAQVGFAELTITGAQVDRASQTFIEIISLTGERIHSQTIVGEETSPDYLLINTETELSPGLYLVVVTNKGRRHTKRLIVK